MNEKTIKSLETLAQRYDKSIVATLDQLEGYLDGTLPRMVPSKFGGRDVYATVDDAVHPNSTGICLEATAVVSNLFYELTGIGASDAINRDAAAGTASNAINHNKPGAVALAEIALVAAYQNHLPRLVSLMERAKAIAENDASPYRKREEDMERSLRENPDFDAKRVRKFSEHYKHLSDNLEKHLDYFGKLIDTLKKAT